MLFQFGNLIDDIRKDIKYFNVQFEKYLFSDRMIITVPNKPNRSIVIDDCYFDNIQVNSKLYIELLELTKSQINMMINN